MVFAKAVADINVDVLYYKMDQNNRKIFWPTCLLISPGKPADCNHMVLGSGAQGFCGETVGLNHKIPFLRMRNEKCEMLNAKCA